MHSFEVHSNESACRKKVRLGMEQVMRILQKGDIQFYRKYHELPHDSGILHLTDKLSPTFRTQKNGVKNATVTQWRTNKNLCPVRIWAGIIIIL